jgi:hypothetical protein
MVALHGDVLGRNWLCWSSDTERDLLQAFFQQTLWPSGLRRWLKAPFRKGVGSNPTGVMTRGQGYRDSLFHKGSRVP